MQGLTWREIRGPGMVNNMASMRFAGQRQLLLSNGFENKQQRNDVT
jgi:hypothetical protein